ncbi:MAG: hypothetical protein ACK4E0_08980 [Chitinophagaceae bacterium]
MEPVHYKSSVTRHWRHIRIVFWGIVGGIGFMFLLALAVHSWLGPFMPAWSAYRNYFLIALALLSFMLLLQARVQMARQINLGRRNDISLTDRLTHYQSGLTRFLAFSELVVMLSTMIFLFNGDFSFLAFAAIICGFILSQMPRSVKIPELLNLDSGERAQWSEIQKNG